MSDAHLGSVLHHLRLLAGVPGAEHVSDRQLLERCARGNKPDALDALVRRHGPLVWRVCRRLLPQVQAAEDAFQATFLALVQQAALLHKVDSLAGWLHRVAYRTSCRLRAELRPLESVAEEVLSRNFPDPCAQAAWRELGRIVEEEVQRLPEKLRLPLVHCYWKGQTHDQAARALDWPLGTLKTRLARARQLLHARLVRRGVTLAEGAIATLLAVTEAEALPVALLLRTSAVVTGGTFSAQVSALAQAAIPGVLAARVKLGVMLVLSVAMAAASVSVVAQQFGGKQQPMAAEEDPPALNREKVQEQAGQQVARTDALGDPLPAGAIARLGTARYRHSGFGSLGFGYLADGKSIVTANMEGSICFWEANSGRIVREIRTEPVSLRAFAWSANGNCFAVGGYLREEGTRLSTSAVRIMDAATGKELRNFVREAHDTMPHTLVVTPDGKYVLSTGSGGAMLIEEVASGAELFRQKFPGDGIASIEMSPDGSLVAVATGPNSHKLFVWKWQAGKEPREIKIPQYAARFIGFSPDGKQLAACSDFPAVTRIWDVASGALTRTLVPRKDMGTSGPPAFSVDGKTLATTDAGDLSGGPGTGAVYLWDLTSGTLKREFRTPGPCGSVALSPDGNYVAARAGQRLHIWDLRTGKDASTGFEGHETNISSVSASVTGLIATASDDHTIRLWDPETGRQRHMLQHGECVRAIAFAPDGNSLVSSSLDNTVRLWDTRTGRGIRKWAGHGSMGGHRSMAFRPDGDSFVSWGDDLNLRLWDAKSGKTVVEHSIRPEDIKIPDKKAGELDQRMNMVRIGKAAFSLDGKFLVLYVAGDFQVFDVATGNVVGSFVNEGKGVLSMTFSPDSKLVLTSGYANPARRMLPDGTRVYATYSTQICWWQVTSGRLQKCVVLPEGGLGPVAISPDGKQVAVGIDKPTPRICFYELATGKLRHTLDGLPAYVKALAFTPDGKRLVAGLSDTTALVWDL